MTIHQLKDPCWVLRHPNGDTEHYAGRAPAEAEVFRLREDDPDPDVTIIHRTTRCWVVECDGECETVLDTEDEGYVFHHDSRAEAEHTVVGYDWALDDDGRVFCEEDRPSGAKVPPSPAELEAAGQMRLPGVA